MNRLLGKYALSRRRASLPTRSASAWDDPLDPDSWGSSGRLDTWSALTISGRGLFCTGGSVGKNSCCNLPLLVVGRQSVKVLRGRVCVEHKCLNTSERLESTLLARPLCGFLAKIKFAAT